MKILSAIAVAAALVSAAPAEAQVFDLSTIKCRDFVEISKDNIAMILMWLEGYYTDEEDPPIVDFDKMKSHTQQIMLYCAQNPTVGLMTAAENIMSK